MSVLPNEQILNQSALPAEAETNNINMQNTCLAWLMLDNVSIWKVMQITTGSKMEPGEFRERVSFKGSQDCVQFPQFLMNEKIWNENHEH